MSAISIDWSKAPEGATRYHPETSKVIEHWLKMVGEDVWIWTSVGKRWVPNIDAVEDGEYHERPVFNWAGGGLPPVGTVCEYRSPDICEPKDWTVVHILAHANHGGDWAVLMAEDYSGRHGKMHGRIWSPDNFRPLRTPEQIAAEKHEQEISELAHDFYIVGFRSYRLTAEDLHKLGYRKAAPAGAQP